MSALFPPSLDAGQARLDAVDPQAYARSRNHLEGAVTRLSPYLTHGLLTLPEAYQRINARTPLEPQGKLVFEFGWREYHHHVWAHLGERIHQSLHAGLQGDANYATQVPEDVRHAATGIPAIDEAVRTRTPLATCTTTRACGWRATWCISAKCFGTRARVG